MPLLRTKLLKEYLLANRTAKSITGGSKCHWNDKTDKIILSQTPYVVCGLFGMAFGLFGVYHAFMLSLGQTKHSQYKGVGVILTSGPLIVYFYTINYLKHRVVLENFLNNLLKLEQKFKHDKISNLQCLKLAKLSCKVLRIAGIRVIGISVALVGTFLPELPFNIFAHGLGNWILSTLKAYVISQDIIRYILEKVFLFCGNLVMWTIHAKVAMLGPIEIIIVSACFVVLIRQLEQKTLQFRILTNSIVILNRQVQLLLDIFNGIISTQLVATLLAFGLTQVASTLELFCSKGKSSKHSSFADIAVKYSMTAFSLSILFNITIVINFLFGSCAQVHDTSRKSLLRLRSRMDFKTSKSNQKIVKSLPALNIKFGNTNFLEKETPVVFQLYLLQRIVDALLLK